MDSEPLTIADTKGIPEAILTLISNWDGLPFKATQKTVCWNNHDFDMGIGCFPMAGAVYLKKYLSGSFVGQIPFSVQYRTAPTTNKGRIDAQKVLEDLGEWLEECSATFKDESITFNQIERTTNAIKIGAYEDGSEVYQNTMILTYTKRR